MCTYITNRIITYQVMLNITTTYLKFTYAGCEYVHENAHKLIDR